MGRRRRGQSSATRGATRSTASPSPAPCARSARSKRRSFWSLPAGQKELEELFRSTLDIGRSRLLRDGYDLPFPQLFERDDARTLALFEERAVRGGFAHILACYNVDLAFGGPSTEGDGDYNTVCSTSLLVVEYEQALVIGGAPNGDCRETQNHYILHTDGSWQRLRQAPFFPDVLAATARISSPSPPRR